MAKQKTRDRIVEKAIVLFNERGYGNVTTAILAKELGISEGNLWYHFNEKRALLSAITLLFIDRNQARRKIRPAGGDLLQEYTEFLKFLGDEIRDYRFLWRDQADYGEGPPELTDMRPRSYDETIEQFRAFFQAMREQGILTLDDKQIEPLIINVIIVVRYFLEFARESGNETAMAPGPIRRSLLQHLELLRHHMTPDAAAHLEKALSD